MSSIVSRERLPQTREGVTRRLAYGGRVYYARVGLYEDGRPGELFLTCAGESGTAYHVILDGLATAVSLALQYGVPLRTFIAHWRGTHDEHAGYTGDATVRHATSVLDAIAQWMSATWPEHASGDSIPPTGRDGGEPSPTVDAFDEEE